MALLGTYAIVALTIGCGEGPGVGKNPGKLRIVLDAGPTLIAGTHDGGFDTDDGCRVSYSRHIVSIGLVSMSKTDGKYPQVSDAIGVADLARPEFGPAQLAVFERIPVGPYPSFGFTTPAPNANAVNLNDVPPSEVDAMIANSWSFVVEGRVTRGLDQAVTRFAIRANVPADYSECGDDGKLGVGVGSNAKATITIHGDHLFFNGFPKHESDVDRLAQWMWDIQDIDGDGILTRADFEAAEEVNQIFPPSLYSLEGSPLPIESAWDFIRAQLATTGHLGADGDCDWGEL